MKVLKMVEFLLEHKFWGKTIPQFLSFLEEKKSKTFIFIDTETTGLREAPYEVQLTQVAAVVCSFDGKRFKEISTFNKKIELNQNTKDIMSNDIERVLNFNHYYDGKDFFDEKDVLFEFKKFVDSYNDSIFVIQNAEFDMTFLNTRSELKFKNDIIDTKQILQLFVIPLYEKLSEEDNTWKMSLKSIGTSQRDLGLVSSSLSKWGPHFGIDMRGYHDALMDCRMTITLFERMILFLKSYQDRDISKYQIKRIKAIKER